MEKPSNHRMNVDVYTLQAERNDAMEMQNAAPMLLSKTKSQMNQQHASEQIKKKLYSANISPAPAAPSRAML